MTQPNHGISINREELAWAAGFFDGEGTTCIRRARNNTGWQGTSIAVSVAQKHRQVLDRFRDAVAGIGKVYENPSLPGCPYTWVAGKFESVQAVIAMLWPFLSTVKKEQAMRALKTYWAEPRQSRADRIVFMRALGKRERVGRQPCQKRPGTSSQFMGVTLDKRTGHWMAQITYGGRYHGLGTFAVEEDAARAYDAAAVAAFGKFAQPNFPEVNA